MDRIDTVVLEAIITTYNEEGLPIHEQPFNAIKLFRASQPDVWGVLDALYEKFKEDAAAKAAAAEVV